MRVFRSNLARDKGFALINAMVVVFVLSTVSFTMLSRSTHSLQILRDQSNAAQVALYLDSLELLIPDLFEAFIERDQPVALMQDWADVQTFDIDEGRVQGRAEDLSGRLNLYTLRTDDKAQTLDMFERLCAALGLSRDVAQAIALEIRKSPFQTAALPTDFPMLRSYPDLIRQTAFLPEANQININTASLPVLQSALPGLSNRFWEAFLDERARRPFAQINELKFRTSQELDTATQEALPWDQFGTRSVHFGVEMTAQLGEVLLGRTLIIRHDTETTVLLRVQNVQPTRIN